MHELNVVTVPDLFSTGIDTVLKSALYFDSIYADGFLPELGRVDKSEDESHPVSIELIPKSQLQTVEALTDLIAAGVVRPLPSGISGLVNSFDSRKLPLAVRRTAAESIEAGAALMSYPIGVALLKQFGNTKSRLIEDPANLDNPAVEITLCTHLICIFTMLGICSDGKASPLVSNAAHIALLRQLAKEFPSVADALGHKNASSLLGKQSAMAMTVLEDTLPSVEVVNPVDILYLRDEMKDELSSFRTEVARLTTMIEAEPWEKNFQKEVDAIVAKEVKPAFDQLRRRLKQPSKRMLAHLVSDWKSIATSATVPVTAIAMTNAYLPLAVLAGIATGLGIAAVKTKVEEWSAKRESSLTFLIEASKALEK